MLVSIITVIIIIGLVTLTVGVLKSVNPLVIFGLDLISLGTIVGLGVWVYHLIKGA